MQIAKAERELTFSMYALYKYTHIHTYIHVFMYIIYCIPKILQKAKAERELAAEKQRLADEERKKKVMYVYLHKKKRGNVCVCA